jgi:hypothetical protein
MPSLRHAQFPSRPVFSGHDAPAGACVKTRAPPGARARPPEARRSNGRRDLGLLELGRIPETHSVVFHCLPADKQPVTAWLLDGAPQLHAVAALRAFENRRGLFHRGFEFRFQPGLTSICAISVIIVVFTPCSQCAAPYHGASGIEVRKRGGLPCQRRLRMRGSCGMWARAAYNQGL